MTDTGSGDCDRVAKTLRWVAGGFAAAMLALAGIVVASSHSHGELETSHGKLETEVALLKGAQSVRSADHDKLIELTVLVTANARTAAANAKAIAHSNAGRKRDLDAILAAIEGR